jgi:hypothetical protein
MARLQSLAQFTYVVGWISAVAAFVYHALFYGGLGPRLLAASSVSPRHLLQLSILSFIITIATDARTFSMNRTDGS